jgi:hypothetical protein
MGDQGKGRLQRLTQGKGLDLQTQKTAAGNIHLEHVKAHARVSGSSQPHSSCEPEDVT